MIAFVGLGNTGDTYANTKRSVIWRNTEDKRIIIIYCGRAPKD